MLGCQSREVVQVPVKVRIDGSAFTNCPQWDTLLLNKGAEGKELVMMGAERLIALKQCNETLDAIKKWNDEK